MTVPEKKVDRIHSPTKVSNATSFNGNKVPEHAISFKGRFDAKKSLLKQVYIKL